MANQKFQVTDALFREVIQKPSVRAALHAKALEKQGLAEQIAESEGEVIDSVVSEGTRPAGRPFARVSSTNIEQEYGTSVVERKRILGRAAES